MQPYVINSDEIPGKSIGFSKQLADGIPSLPEYVAEYCRAAVSEAYFHGSPFHFILMRSRIFVHLIGRSLSFPAIEDSLSLRSLLYQVINYLVNTVDTVPASVNQSNFDRDNGIIDLISFLFTNA